MARLQALLRPWGTLGDQIRTDASRTGAALTLVNAVIEGIGTPGETAPDEIHEISFGADLALCRIGPARCVDRDVAATMATACLPGALTEPIWTIECDPTRLAGLLYTRPCALPGGHTRLAIGLLGGLRLAEPKRYEGAGGARDGCAALLGHGGAAEAPPSGSAADAAYRAVRWGWSDEPVGFQTTLRPQVADLVDELHDLPPPGLRSAAQQRRAETLQRRTGGIGHAGRNDPQYARFLAAYRADPLAATASRVPLTAAQFAAREALADRIVAGLARSA